MNQYRQSPVAPEVLDDIAQRLRDGQYICDIARAAGVAESTVRKVGKQRGIEHARCKRGTRWGMFEAHRKATPILERNYRAEATAMRWGRNTGGGFW